MVSGCPISNRSQIYFWKDFYCPELSTCSANLNLGVFGKLIFEITIWPNCFCKNYFYVLYTWHDHWARFWIKDKKYKSWRILLIFRALANSRQKSNQAKTKHSKVFVKPHFIMIY